MGIPLAIAFAQWGTPGIETSQYRQEEKAICDVVSNRE
jgi:hypothetical protein